MVNSHREKNYSKCWYYNRGLCKVGHDCDFIHAKEDCKTHEWNCEKIACLKKNKEKHTGTAEKDALGKVNASFFMSIKKQIKEPWVKH